MIFLYLSTHEISKQHHNLIGCSKQRCIVDYMRIAQSIPTYGQHLYPVKNKTSSGRLVWLSVGVGGLKQWSNQGGGGSKEMGFGDGDSISLDAVRDVDILYMVMYRQWSAQKGFLWDAGVGFLKKKKMVDLFLGRPIAIFCMPLKPSYIGAKGSFRNV